MNIFLNSGMSNFNSNFLSFVLGFIYLTDRSRCNRILIKLFKYLFYLFIIISLEHFLGIFKSMLWRMFPQMYKFLRHLWPDNIPSMTHILKRFDPNNTSPFNSRNKTSKPIILHKLEIAQWKQNDNR